MPVNLDKLTVLPKMSEPRQKKQVFRLLWPMDLVSDHTNCFVTLVFQNVNKKTFFFDTIPPELLCFFTVGSYYSEGKKFTPRKSDGKSLAFSIISDDNNQFEPARKIFSDREYDLSLNGIHPVYSDVCKRQICFVQQVNDIKVVIPCFVLATAYYFKTTSLREAITSRKMESLYHKLDVDDKTRHAEIHLKQAGNVGDAKNIARFAHDDFARRRINLCKDHLYAQRNSTYKTLKVDFPVREKIDINARGHLETHEDGSKTFIVFQILEEDSSYPFDTITIKTDETDLEDMPEGSNDRSYPKGKPKKSAKRMNNESYSDNLVRQLIESSEHIENKNADKITVERIRISKPLPEEAKKPRFEETEEEIELSTQPGSTKDTNTARASIREKEEQAKKVSEATLDKFITLANSLKDYKYTVSIGNSEISGQITNYHLDDDKKPVKKRNDVKYCSIRESYNNLQTNLRKCVSVRFLCAGKNVCLVEIDQAGLPENSLGTVVLTSKRSISNDDVDAVTDGFVRSYNLVDRAKAFEKKQIHFMTRKHPISYDENGMKSWRDKLIAKILAARC